MARRPDCVICLGDEGGCDVYFSPCLHKACNACVKKLRIASVYKPDKGVKCPFCGQTVEAYLSSLPTSTTKLEVPSVHSQRTYGRDGNTSIGNGNDYVPHKVSAGITAFVPKMDELPPGYIVPPLKAESDLFAMAMDRAGARHLDSMLRDGHPKRHKVAKMCRDTLVPFSAKLAVHAFGNFVFQRMLEYAAAHRGNAGSKDCFYTALVRALCRENGIVVAAQDSRGMYSVQRILMLMRGSEELRLVMKSISGSVVLLSTHPNGIHSLERLVESLIASVKSSSNRFPVSEAQKALAQLAAEATLKEKSILSMAKHQLSAQIFVECIRWALPERQAVAAAMALATNAKQLISVGAHRILQGVLSLDLKEVAEQLINSLQGEFLTLALDQGYGLKLIRACFATRSVDEALRISILEELIVSPKLAESQFACTVLAFGLSLLTQRNLDECLHKIELEMGTGRLRKITKFMEGYRQWFSRDVPMDSESTGDTRNRSDPWQDEYSASSALSSNRSDSTASSDLSQLHDSWSAAATSPISSPVPTCINAFQVGNQSYAASTAAPIAHSMAYPPPQARGFNSSELCPIPRAIQGPPLQLQQQQQPCVVCGTEQASFVLLDCAHMCCCGHCAFSIIVCPICQLPVRQVLEVKPIAPSRHIQPQPQILAQPAEVTPYDFLPSDLYDALSDVWQDTPPALNTRGLDPGIGELLRSVPHSNGTVGIVPKPYRPPDIFSNFRT